MYSFCGGSHAHAALFVWFRYCRNSKQHVACAPNCGEAAAQRTIVERSVPDNTVGTQRNNCLITAKMPTTKMSSTAHPPLSPTACEFRNPKIVAAINGLFSLSWPIAAIFAP
jgi:hypothetical protein